MFEKNISSAYSLPHFDALTTHFVEHMRSYFERNLEASPQHTVLPKYFGPKQAETALTDWIEESQGLSAEDKFSYFLEFILKHSNQLHHPRYIGHQVASPLPMAALTDAVSDFLNNGSAVFEMGPVETAVEKWLADYFGQKIGWDDCGGFFTSGGSLANLTSLLIARNHKAADIEVGRLGIIVPAESHYSISRTLNIMGIKPEHIFVTPSIDDHMDTSALEALYQQAQNKNVHIFAISCNAPSTATGSFDPIDEIAAFAEKHKLWLHVDACHGGPIIFSSTHRHKLSGLEKADSVAIDIHKMMMMPALCTLVAIKNRHISYEGFIQKASYIFSQNRDDEWYNLGKRTFECTKKMMGLKVFITLHAYGEAFFAAYIDKCFDLTETFYHMLKKHEGFEPYKKPDFNIICFAMPELDDEALSQLYDKTLNEGRFYIVKTTLNDKLYLRCTIINPLTEVQHLQELIDYLVYLRCSLGAARDACEKIA